MGRSGNKRRKPGKASAKAAAAANGSGALVGPVSLHLVAEPEFYEAADSAGCPGSLKAHSDDGLPGLLLVLEDVSKLGDLLGWFAAGAAEDSNAKLEFPASLTSAQRAELHQLVSSKFSEQLEAYSSGVAEARHISVCKKGCAPSRELSAEQDAKVLVLYPLAKDAGLTFSRDEIADCILQGSLPGPLEEVWQATGKRVWISQQLCNAAALGNLATLQALIADDASVLKESVQEPQQGCLPLQAAAVAGQVESIKALHAAGADLEAVDGSGRTPLQAARHAEQCDAEAALLQLGAVDPDADVMPVAADEDAAGEEEDAAEASPEEQSIPPTAAEAAPPSAPTTPAAAPKQVAKAPAAEPPVAATKPEPEVVPEAAPADAACCSGSASAEKEVAKETVKEAVSSPAQASTSSSSAPAAAEAASSVASVCEQLRNSVATSSTSGADAPAAASQAGPAAPAAAGPAKGKVGAGEWSTASLGVSEKWLMLGTSVAVCGAALLLYRRLR